MRQVLWSWGPIDVQSHDFFVALGLLTGFAVFLWAVRDRGVWDERLIPVIACLLAGGAIGGRLSGVLEAGLAQGTGAAALAWQYGGRSILGGLTGAYAGVLIGKRLGGYPGRTGDLFAPAAALGIAVGRIGCFLAEAPGRPTDLPWGVSVDQAAARIPDCPGCDAGVAMHPSMLYESAFLVLAFWALVRIRGRVSAPGELLVLFLGSYAVFRFGVEFTRANEITDSGLTRSQLFILALSPLLAWRLVASARLGRYDGLIGRRPFRGAASGPQPRGAPNTSPVPRAATQEPAHE